VAFSLTENYISFYLTVVVLLVVCLNQALNIHATIRDETKFLLISWGSKTS